MGLLLLLGLFIGVDECVYKALRKLKVSDAIRYVYNNNKNNKWKCTQKQNKENSITSSLQPLVGSRIGGKALWLTLVRAGCCSYAQVFCVNFHFLQFLDMFQDIFILVFVFVSVYFSVCFWFSYVCGHSKIFALEKQVKASMFIFPKCVWVYVCLHVCVFVYGVVSQWFLHRCCRSGVVYALAGNHASVCVCVCASLLLLVCWLAM